MNILQALIYIAPMLFGAILASSLPLLKEKISNLLVGAIGGLSLAITITYAASMIFGLGEFILWMGVMTSLLGTAITLYYSNWKKWRKLPFDKWALACLLLTLLLFSIIAPKLLIVQDDGLYTGIINAYGDVGWHAANITMFAEGQSVPPENPIFAKERLTYPFLTNFFSGMLVAANEPSTTDALAASLSTSITIPALILIPILLTLLYCFARDYSGRKLVGIIALLLFLFGGATLGWIRFGADLQESGVSVVEFLWNLPARDYSGVGTDENGFHFLNPTTSLLLPQRSFMFGMSLAFAILLLLRPYKNKKRDSAYLAAGVLAGILPLFHAHTVLALIPAIIVLFILKPGAHWLLFLLPAGIIGIPEVLYFTRGQYEAGSFFRFAPGWMSENENIIWYWIKNTGLLLPLSIAGLFIKKAPRIVKYLAAAGLFIFLLSNIFLFAPWAWDNFKLLVFWLIFSLPLIGWIAARYIHPSRHIFIRTAVVALLGIHMLSAGLDIWKITIPTARTWQEWDTASIAIAQTIRQTTKQGDSIATSPVHNSPVALTGRSQYLGYPAHVWSHGGAPATREQALTALYTNGTIPNPIPEYVLIGPAEHSRFSITSIPKDWKPVIEHELYTLYRLP